MMSILSKKDLSDNNYLTHKELDIKELCPYVGSYLHQLLPLDS